MNAIKFAFDILDNSLKFSIEDLIEKEKYAQAMYFNQMRTKIINIAHYEYDMMMSPEKLKNIEDLRDDIIKRLINSSSDDNQKPNGQHRSCMIKTYE